MSDGHSVLQLSPEIRAAIVWDVPTLRSGSASAQDLVHAFGPPPWHEVPDDGEPLRAAAIGVLAAARGQLTEALNAWSALVSSDSREEQLLGHLLRLWVRLAQDERLADLEKALELALMVANDDDRARACRKIATAAQDSGHMGLARAAAEAALAAAEDGAEIHRAVRWLLFDLGDRELGMPSFEGFSDDVLTQPWITEQGLAGVTEADLNRFKDGLKSVWGGFLRIGQTPLDVLNAAQRQADWAGLSTRRDSLIRLMCSHILESPASSDSHVRWAVTAWILAGGGDIASVLSRSEPRLDADFAHELLDTITQVPTGTNVVPQVAAGIWRIAPDDDVDRLLAMLDPGPADEPVPPEARQVWANLLWRAPVEWLLAWRRLDAPRRIAVIEELLPDLADVVTAELAGELLATCEGAPDNLLGRIAAPAAAFSTVLERDPRPWIEKALPSGVMELVRWRRSVVPEDVLRAVVAELKEAAEARRQDALEGRYGLGGGGALVMIGRGIAAIGQPDLPAESLLLSIAGDRQMSVDDQLAALQAVALIHDSGLLSDDGIDTLRSLETAPGVQPFGTVQVGALRAAQLYALGESVSSEEESEVFAGCRASSEQVRLLSVAALEAVLSARPSDPGASWSLLSALYDPSDDVLARALDVLTRTVEAVDLRARSTALNAVVSAYRRGRHVVRLSSVQASRALEAFAPSEQMQRLLAAAATDPSWEVRRLIGDQLASTGD